MTAGSLLPVVGIARGTYHYQLNAMKRPDKDSGLLELVREAFENSKRGYGYKRVHLEPESMGVRVSAKRVMRLTARHGLAPLFKSAKRYGSYKGEPAKAPKNLADRDFHAERPNRLWITDPAGFSIPAGKAYLSPVIDCHDGLPVAWTIGTSPNAALANGMLADACSTLRDGEKPIIHSDRGCRYRWPAWMRRCRDGHLRRAGGVHRGGRHSSRSWGCLRGRCLANPIRIHRKALRPFQRPKVLRVPLALPCTKYVANPLRQVCLARLHCGFSCDFPAAAPRCIVPCRTQVFAASLIEPAFVTSPLPYYTTCRFARTIGYPQTDFRIKGTHMADRTLFGIGIWSTTSTQRTILPLPRAFACVPYTPHGVGNEWADGGGNNHVGRIVQAEQ